MFVRPVSPRFQVASLLLEAGHEHSFPRLLALTNVTA